MKTVLFILDCSFDMEAELTPLESAINVLEMIKTEFTLTEAVVESSRKLVKEAVRLYFYFLFPFDKEDVFEDTMLIFSVWGWRKPVSTLKHRHTQMLHLFGQAWKLFNGRYAAFVILVVFLVALAGGHNPQELGWH